MTNDVRRVVEQPALHQRAWDLLRQMRGHLADENLISDEEYVWLAIDAPNMTDPKGGSPAPRRLESYDETRERAEKAEADLAEVARQRDAYRERSRSLRNRLRNSERLRLASPPAPSGWQPIASAQKAFQAGWDAAKRDAAAADDEDVADAADVAFYEWLKLPDAPWQNVVDAGQPAKDALPLSSSDDRSAKCWKCGGTGYYDAGKGGCACPECLDVDALPPVSESSQSAES